jgi:hypothetical protein
MSGLSDGHRELVEGRAEPVPGRDVGSEFVVAAACDGRQDAGPGRAGRVIIADTTAWPGIPVTACPPASPRGYVPPRGRGIAVIPGDVPLTCWRAGCPPPG